MNIRKIIATVLSAGIIASLIPTTSLADSSGWRGSYADGWRYYTSDSEYVKSNWKQIDGNWYYFQEDGIAIVSAWATVDGKLYHFNSTGAMDKNKWIDCGELQFSGFGESRAEENERYAAVLSEYRGKRNWRYVGSDGAAYVGWKKVDGEWYFFSDNEGNEYEGWLTNYGMMTYFRYSEFYTITDRYTYCFDSNGHYYKNCWHEDTYLYSTRWFYYGSDGHAYTGWHKIDGNWYYFDTKFAFMYTGCTLEIDSSLYCLRETGEMITGWYFLYDNWVYADSDGALYRNKWKKSNGKWYYFDNNGFMVKDETAYFINGKMYNFDSDGVCTNPSTAKQIKGWHEITGSAKPDYISGYIWAYVDSNGLMYRNRWLYENNNWYYFDENGYQVREKALYSIDGKHYTFENGICTNHDQEKKTGWSKETPYEKRCWSYYGSDGRFVTGWNQINNNWYYFDEDGIMYSSCVFDPIDSYYLDENGVMCYGWINHNDEWYYAGSNGAFIYYEWLYYNGEWYYFLGTRMYHGSESIVIDCKEYDFAEDGHCLNPYDGRNIVMPD